MKHDSDVHKPHLNGYDKLTEPGRIALAISSLSFYPLEAALVMIMEDDRFYRRCNELLGELETEASYVIGLPYLSFRKYAQSQV